MVRLPSSTLNALSFFGCGRRERGFGGRVETRRSRAFALPAWLPPRRLRHGFVATPPSAMRACLMTPPSMSNAAAARSQGKRIRRAVAGFHVTRMRRKRRGPESYTCVMSSPCASTVSISGCVARQHVKIGDGNLCARLWGHAPARRRRAPRARRTCRKDARQCTASLTAEHRVHARPAVHRRATRAGLALVASVVREIAKVTRSAFAA